MTDVPVTVPTAELMVRLVAPVTDQLSVLDCPRSSFAGVAVRVAMVGRVAVAAAAGDTPAMRRNTTVVIGMIVQSAYRPALDNLAIAYTLVVTVTLPEFSPGEEAVTRISPGLPVDCTMARHNPLNAFRRLDW